MQVSAPSDGARAGVRYARLSGIAWRLVAHRVVACRVADRTASAPVTVRGVAAMVWVALDEPRTAAQLEADVAQAAGAGPGSGVTAALEQLLHWNLIGTTA